MYLCWVLAIAGMLLLVASPHVRNLSPGQFEIMGEVILGRYIDALAFFMHLLGVYGVTRSVNDLPSRFRSTISTVAATTFPLYLLHRPLIQLFSYAGPDDAASWQRRVLLIVGTLVFVVLATPAIEKLRMLIRGWMTSLLARRRMIGRQLDKPSKGPIA